MRRFGEPITITEEEQSALKIASSLLRDIVLGCRCEHCPIKDICRGNERALCEITAAAVEGLIESCKVEKEPEENVESDWVKDREEPYDAP